MSKSKEADMYGGALVCPACMTTFLSDADDTLCSGCGASIPVIKGIPCFAKDTSAWSLFDKHTSDAILHKAHVSDWQNAIKDLSPIRAGWISGLKQFPVSILCSPKGRVLECGSGWGGLTFWLAREFVETYALDVRLDGLEFIKIRAAQDGVSSVHPVQGSVLSLPFAASFFDAVVFNGVLERVGDFTQSEPLEILQEKTLLEIRRVLKSDGVLCMAAANRFRPYCFPKHKEEHAGIVSVLPGSDARLQHRAVKRRGFRAPAFSRRTLVRLLEECGFGKSLCFVAYPSHVEPRYVVSLNGLGPLSFLLSSIRPFFFRGFRRGSWLTRKIGGVSDKIARVAALLFSPSWIIMASGSDMPRLGISSTNAIIEAGLSKKSGLAIAITNRSAGLFVVDNCSGKIIRKYSVPISGLALFKARVAQACIAYIRKNSPALTGHIPESVLHETGHGPVSVTERVEGRSLDVSDVRSVKGLSEIIGMFSSLNVEPAELPGIYERIDIREDLLQIVRAYGLSADLIPYLRSGQFIHSDLNSGNILVDRPSAKITLLDFEHARIGPGILNWYDFLLRNFVIYSRRYPLKEAVVIKRLEKLAGKPCCFDCTKELLHKYGVPQEFHAHLTALYMGWLCRDRIIDNPGKVLDMMKNQVWRLS